MPEVTKYRLEEAERILKEHEALLKEIPLIRKDVSHLAEAVQEGRQEVKSLRHTAIGVAASVTGSSVIFALTLFFAL